MKILKVNNDCNNMPNLWMRLQDARSTIVYSLQTSRPAQRGT